MNVGLTSYVYEDVYVQDMSQLLRTCPDQINMYHTVGNEICSGTERENFKPGTTGTESIRTNEKDTTDNATHA